MHDATKKQWDEFYEDIPEYNRALNWLEENNFQTYCSPIEDRMREYDEFSKKVWDRNWIDKMWENW